MVRFTNFLEASQAADCAGRDPFAEHCLGVAKTNEPEELYLQFHAEHVDKNGDNLCVNSFCLPVYATKLAKPPPTQAELAAVDLPAPAQAESRRTKRGAREVKQQWKAAPPAAVPAVKAEPVVESDGDEDYEDVAQSDSDSGSLGQQLSRNSSASSSHTTRAGRKAGRRGEGSSSAAEREDGNDTRTGGKRRRVGTRG